MHYYIVRETEISQSNIYFLFLFTEIICINHCIKMVSRGCLKYPRINFVGHQIDDERHYEILTFQLSFKL